MHLAEASSCFRAVAACTTWHCKSCPYSRSGPDVCRCLWSIQKPVEILCAYLAFEIADESSCLFSKKLFLNSPSLGDTRAALHFSHSEHHVTISFFATKYRMDRGSNFSLVNRLVFSVGIKKVPQVQWMMPSAQYFEQWEHWELEDISHKSMHSKSILRIISFDSSPKGLYVQFFSKSAINAAFL